MTFAIQGEAIEHCHECVQWHIEVATGKSVPLVRPWFHRQSLLVQTWTLGNCIKKSASTGICGLGVWVLGPNSLRLLRLLPSGQFHVGMTTAEDLR